MRYKLQVTPMSSLPRPLIKIHTNLQSVCMCRGRELASCAHTLNTTSEAPDVRVRLKGCCPPFSFIHRSPRHANPSSCGRHGRHGTDRLEVSVSRCVHAGRPPPRELQSERGWREEKQLLFQGIWSRWGLKMIACSLLPPIC